MTEEYFDDEFEERGPSKSQRKREMQLLRDLGEKLLSLPVDHLEKISEPAIIVAVQDCKKITKGNARKRQIQFIGKLLACLLYTSPSPRDQRGSRMPSSA